MLIALADLGLGDVVSGCRRWHRLLCFRLDVILKAVVVVRTRLRRGRDGIASWRVENRT